jgi:uncharacterized membrane protein
MAYIVEDKTFCTFTVWRKPLGLVVFISAIVSVGSIQTVKQCQVQVQFFDNGLDRQPVVLVWYVVFRLRSYTLVCCCIHLEPLDQSWTEW